MNKSILLIFLYSLGATYTIYGQTTTDLKARHQQIKGTWINVKDPKSETVISNSKWTDFYNGKKLGESSYYFIPESDTMLVLFDTDTLVYKLKSVDSDNLTLLYLGLGLGEHDGFVTILDMAKKK